MRLLNNDDFTASLAWSTCNSAGVSPENKGKKQLKKHRFISSLDVILRIYQSK